MVRNPIAESLKSVFRNIDTLRFEYEAKQAAIEARLEEFRRTGREGDERLFEELCFCLIAVQSKARTSDAAVAALRKAELLWSGGPEEIAAFLQHRTRFHNHKAAFIVHAREQFFPRGRGELAKMLDSFRSSKDARGWLVREVRGLGLKEASHFLRNTGRGEDLAILDRHILRNLTRHGVLRCLPRSLTPKRYLDIEGRLERFSKEIGIPMAALDLIFWSRETGEIFK
jgi:N-glycosylase/DNA lyase